MYQQVKISQCEGKTIKSVKSGYNDLLISFTDETFTFIEPDVTYDVGELEFDKEFNPHHFDHNSVLVPLFGEDGADELLNFHTDRAKRWEEERKERVLAEKREQYERLKKEFGD